MAGGQLGALPAFARGVEHTYSLEVDARADPITAVPHLVPRFSLICYSLATPPQTAVTPARPRRAPPFSARAGRGLLVVASRLPRPPPPRLRVETNPVLEHPPEPPQLHLPGVRRR